ncbi:unnamed protein product [Colias eurytheme]|nr:unnamed protein product [Colias eurytheme]
MTLRYLPVRLLEVEEELGEQGARRGGTPWPWFVRWPHGACSAAIISAVARSSLLTPQLFATQMILDFI